MTRDQERRQEVLDLFSEFDRHDWADQVLFERFLVLSGQRRAADSKRAREPGRVARHREHCRAWYYSQTLEQRRAMHQRQWERRGPQERARRAARENARYQALTAAQRRERNARHYGSIMADPARAARRRERAAAKMREYRGATAQQEAV